MQEIFGYIKFLLPLIGVGAFFYIIYDIGISQITKAIGNINWLFFILSLALFVPRILASTYKWKMIAREQGITVGLGTLINLNLVGIFYGTITPLWLGDYIRIPYLQRRTGEQFGKCASSVLIDQVLELVALFVLALGGSLILIGYRPIFFQVFFIIFIVLIILSWFLKEKKRSEKLFSIFYRFCIPRTLKSFFSQEFNSFYEHMPTMKFLFLPLLLEIGSYVLFFTHIYILALSLPFAIPYLSFIFIYPIASLVGLIPITISGFGTREGMLIHLFSLYNIPSDTTVAVSLTGYCVTMLIPSLIGGVVAIFQAKKK